jgi:hypothetical protein
VFLLAQPIGVLWEGADDASAGYLVFLLAVPVMSPALVSLCDIFPGFVAAKEYYSSMSSNYDQ